jgi:hypothetical protein
MENQHRKISGYRELNQAEIDLMNAIKATEGNVMAMVEKVLGLPEYPTPPEVRADMPSKIYRHAYEARDYLEIGFMLLVRSIAKPGAPDYAPPRHTMDAQGGPAASTVSAGTPVS